jgi:SAM-dependent methyltransferase
MNYTDPIERLRAPYRLVVPGPDARILELSVHGPEAWLARHWRGGPAMTAAMGTEVDALLLSTPEALAKLTARFDLIILHDFLDHCAGEGERIAWLQSCANLLAPAGALAASLDNPWNLSHLGALLRQPRSWFSALSHPLHRLHRYQEFLRNLGLEPGGLYAMAPSRNAPAYLTNLRSDDYPRQRLSVFGAGYTPWYHPRLWVKGALVYSGISRFMEPAYFFWAARHAPSA